MKRWNVPGLIYPDELPYRAERGRSISAGIAHARGIRAEQIVALINDQGLNAGAAAERLGISRRSVLNKLRAVGRAYDVESKRVVCIQSNNEDVDASRPKSQPTK